MTNQLLHTPNGVRDLYNLDCARKHTIEKAIRKTIYTYGFRDIETPTFEFFDIFNKERGSVASNDMYKFFDKDNNTLVLRPDITPSIARSIAKYYSQEEMPIRLSYGGNTFYNNSDYQGKLKEVTQIGAELVLDETSDADAEMIACVIDCLLASGLKDFQVEIGQVDYLDGLIEEANLLEEDEMLLRELIENKNHFGIEDLLSSKDVVPYVREGILSVTQMFGSLEQILEAKQYAHGEKAKQAIVHLEKLYQILTYYGFESYVTFDLSMLGRYRYYTGIIFQAYTHGTGEQIVRGGRYDNLIEQFGKKAPSVGFAINVDQLLLAMERQKIEVETDIVGTILLYERNQKEMAIKLARHLRKAGDAIQLMKKFHEYSLEDYMALAKRSFIGGILYLDESGETVEVIPMDGEKTSVSIQQFLQ